MQKRCPAPPGPGSAAASPPAVFVQDRCSASQDIPSLNISKFNGRAGSSAAVRDSAGGGGSSDSSVSLDAADPSRLAEMAWRTAASQNAGPLRQK